MESKDRSGLYIGRLTASLDFYSDRATAHASLFVASIFGLFALLSLIQQALEEWVILLSVFVYFRLAYAGYITLTRFSYLAGVAHRFDMRARNGADLSNLKV